MRARGEILSRSAYQPAISLSSVHLLSLVRLLALRDLDGRPGQMRSSGGFEGDGGMHLTGARPAKLVILHFHEPVLPLPISSRTPKGPGSLALFACWLSLSPFRSVPYSKDTNLSFAWHSS
jgi:hypothetical protein